MTKCKEIDYLVYFWYGGLEIHSFGIREYRSGSGNTSKSGDFMRHTSDLYSSNITHCTVLSNQSADLK